MSRRTDDRAKITLRLSEPKNQEVILSIPIESLIQGLIDYAEGSELEYLLPDAFGNSDAVKLTMTRVAPRPRCTACGAVEGALPAAGSAPKGAEKK
jgi:hypothetical protein